MSAKERPARTWTVRRATADDRTLALELTLRAFGQDVDPRAGAVWDWLFLRNASGQRMHYLVADAGTRLAGQYTVIPVRMQHEGKPVVGLLSLHTATDPDFQRQGIMTTLANELYAQASAEAPIVYGFPNPSSAPAFFGKCGWVEIRPFPLLFRPIGRLGEAVTRWRPALGGAGAVAGLAVPALRFATEVFGRLGGDPSASVEPFDRFGPWADDLWNQLAPDLGTCAVRDAALLEWRYVDAPFAYRRLALVRDGVPTGFAVVGQSSWRGLPLAWLMELMVPKGDAAGARTLLAEVLRDAAREGAFGIATLATRRHPHRRALLTAGLLPAPRWLRTDGGFGARHNGPGVTPNRLFHVDDWYLSGTDLDFI